MKSFASILIVLLLIAGFIFILTRDNTGMTTSKSVLGASESATDERDNVTVTVRPVDLNSQSSEWGFDITMSTHSVELDHNLSESVILVGTQGETYKPIAWQGSEASGHHRDNTVIFNSIVPTPEIIELRIDGVGGQGTRIFKWAINK